MVTFSKKMQGAGFYHNFELRPNQTYRNFNTWMVSSVLRDNVFVKKKDLKFS